MRSRQLLPHALSPVAHWHVPPVHVELKFASHALPQPPQLSKFVLVSTQVPLQEVSFALAQPQLPPVHTSPAPQTLPQVPQLFESV